MLFSVDECFEQKQLLMSNIESVNKGLDLRHFIPFNLARNPPLADGGSTLPMWVD